MSLLRSTAISRSQSSQVEELDSTKSDATEWGAKKAIYFNYISYSDTNAAAPISTRPYVCVCTWVCVCVCVCVCMQIR